MKIKDYCIVNNGIKPTNNEDNIYANGFFLSRYNDGINNYESKINSTRNELVYAIFDGIGGLSNGELASFIGVSNVNNGIKYINKKLLEIKKEQNIELGTTCCIARIKGSMMHLEQVGDSPVYIYSNSKLIKFIEKNNDSNLLDNYLGNNNDIYILNNDIKLKRNDIVLMCSDGLSSLLNDEEIISILKSNNDIKFMSYKLVNEALKKGGNDNISIIILKIEKFLGLV